MKVALRFFRKWWWLGVTAGAAILTIIWKIFSRPSSDPGPIETSEPKKTMVEKARDKVEKVHLEGEVEKAKVRVEAKGQMERIEAIEKTGEQDPKEARRQLAEFLAANL